MTDDKAKKTGKSPQVPTVTDKAEPKSNFAKSAQTGKKAAPQKDNTRKGGLGWLWLLVLAAVLGGIGAWGWFNWPQVRSNLAEHLDFLPGTGDQATEVIAVAPEPAPVTERETAAPESAAPTQPERPPAPVSATDVAGNSAILETQQQAIATLVNQLRQQRTNIAQLQEQLAELQRSVTAQGNRLGELGNTSRQDWQLAEADYLLRLANQRLMLERDSRAALGLLEEVDNILRQVDLPDLYGVRQQLARDITELKLVENIDLEGIYLRLRAVEEQMLRTSIQPEFDLATPATSQPESDTETEVGSPWTRSWENFTQFMRDSVRIRDGDIDPVLLSPQSEARFRQSLRLNMEQAELALLRADATVYKDSLNRARQLLLDYGVASGKRDLLAAELEELANQNIVADLPSLAASQSALHNYIERLHKTGPTPTTPQRETPSNTPEVRFPGDDGARDSAEPGSTNQ